ncbi:response regulator [Chloroflexota bacterium]
MFEIKSFQDVKLKSYVVGDDELALGSLLEKVYQEGGYDFRQYKRGTVVRRLGRRLHATGCGNYAGYMRFLDIHPEEYRNLAAELSIKVSGFFRSQDTFRKIAEFVLPQVLAAKQECGDNSLRFWSAACARGEEPYSIAMMLCELLGKRRHDFNISLYATDISLAALEAATREKPDLIIMDIQLPKMSGIEVTRKLRQMPEFAQVPIVAITAYAMKGDRERLLEAGCDVYVPKPINTRELPKVVVGLLPQERRRGKCGS